MGLQGPIVAATDFSEAADAAVRQGQGIASDLKTRLVVCHVLPEAFRVRVLFPQDAGIDPAAQEELERRARQVLHERVASLIGSGHAAELEIDSGSAHAGILTVAERVKAGLIVLGPGRTALRVARAAGAPVLIARPSPTGGAVLGATDFSDPALPAVHMAADEAKRRNSRLRLIHCLDTDSAAYLAPAGAPGMMPMPPPPPTILKQLENAAQARLRRALDAIGAPGEAIVIHRQPGAGIVETADSVATALIVVGTRGRTGLARIALGSVAEDVAGHAPCSVLVVPLRPVS